MSPDPLWALVRSLKVLGPEIRARGLGQCPWASNACFPVEDSCSGGCRRLFPESCSALKTDLKGNNDPRRWNHEMQEPRKMPGPASSSAVSRLGELGQSPMPSRFQCLPP